MGDAERSDAAGADPVTRETSGRQFLLAPPRDLQPRTQNDLLDDESALADPFASVDRPQRSGSAVANGSRSREPTESASG